MADPIVENVQKAINRVMRAEHELVKALEDLNSTFEEEGIESPANIQNIIDQLDADMYDLEYGLEELSTTS
jgi:hypothetical protein